MDGRLNESESLPSILPDMKSAQIIFPVMALSLVTAIASAQQTQAPQTNAEVKPQPVEHTPVPSGPQTDGKFRKVILDADRQIDGVWQDSVKDPMELAVAADGRVFYAQRDGTIRMWKPDTKKTSTIAKI